MAIEMTAAAEVRRPRRRLRVAALALILALPMGYAAISLAVADQLTRASNRPSLVDIRELDESAEGWSTQTADGLTLRGWYLPTPEHRRLLVLVHGMRDSWDKIALIGLDLHARGYDVLLFDLRGHGGSDPSRLFMGRNERGDLRAVQGWAGTQGFTPDRIGWLGQSMGASALLMEAARNPGIRAAVMDSPYGDLPELLAAQLPRHSHLPAFFNPGILLAAHWAFGVRTDDLVPIRSARAWGDRPMLLIHGEEDEIVPVDQAIRIAHAAGPTCRAVTLPGVMHVRAYAASPAQYIAAVDEFFGESLAK
ncbi:alpha/beta fold hydrolase [Isosphaeraceae bacterium EP7]